MIPKGNATVIPADITRQIAKAAGMPVDPNPQYGTDNADYDMTGYHAKYGAPKKAEDEHYTDEFKLPNHITFSDQSRYHNDSQQGGQWQQAGNDRYLFKPSAFNLSQHSPDEYADYFANYERKGTAIQLPDGRIIVGSK